MNRQQKFFLLLFDILLVTAATCVVVFIREGVTPHKVLQALGFWFIASSILGLQYIFGSYDLTYSSSGSRVAGRVLLATLVSFGFIVLVNYFFGERTGIFGRGVLLGTLFIYGTVALFVRWVICSILRRAMRKSRTLIVTSRKFLDPLMKDLEKNRFLGHCYFILDQVLDTDSAEQMGAWSQVDETLKMPWSSIVVAVEETAPKELIQKLMMARFDVHRVRDLVQFYEELWQKIPLYYIGARWFLHTDGFSLFGNPLRNRVKRFMDVGISFGILILASPLMLLAAILIKIESRGPVIYSQVRTGREGKRFVIHKFRSMRVDAEKDGVQWAQKNDNRVTWVGKIIRKTRVDELPQLINVLQGNMSFVGPRPERPEFNVDLREKIAFYDLRHLIHPGLTGWAQVLYPYGASVEDAEQKLQYDLFYIKNHSLWLDISIVLKTVTVVLFGRGQ